MNPAPKSMFKHPKECISVHTRSHLLKRQTSHTQEYHGIFHQKLAHETHPRSSEQNSRKKPPTHKKKKKKRKNTANLSSRHFQMFAWKFQRSCFVTQQRDLAPGQHNPFVPMSLIKCSEQWKMHQHMYLRSAFRANDASKLQELPWVVITNALTCSSLNYLFQP